MINNYCAYCHSAISSEEAYTVDTDENVYHPICYSQLHTFSDEFGTYSIEEMDSDNNV